jgi:hypothetical protein
MSTVRVSFKDSESRAKAAWLILTSKEDGFSKVVGNRPPRDLIIDVKALKPINEAGIKVYPPAKNNQKPLYKKELNVDELLAKAYSS